MKDHNYVNFRDTDVEDPHHEIKGWLRRNGYRETQENIEVFIGEGDRIKKELNKTHITWKELKDNISHNVFEKRIL